MHKYAMGINTLSASLFFHCRAFLGSPKPITNEKTSFPGFIDEVWYWYIRETVNITRWQRLLCDVRQIRRNNNKPGFTSNARSSLTYNAEPFNLCKNHNWNSNKYDNI